MLTSFNAFHTGQAWFKGFLKPGLASLVLVGLWMILTLSNAHASNLQIGQDAPNFSLLNQHHQAVELKALQGKWVVVYFYPKNETPGCTTEACSFRDNINHLIAQDAVILGISLDTAESHAAFAQNHQLPFDLLADTDGKVAASFDALLDLKVVKFAKRHSFIITPQGKLAKIYRDVNADTHVREVLKDLQTLQAQR